MGPSEPDSSGARSPSDWFPTTHWSVVLEAGQGSTAQAQEALEKLCQAYWYPVYAFVRRKGHAVEEAQDLTQAFFARILERQSLKSANPGRGKFRSFLLGALGHFLADEWDRSHCQKRGGNRVILSLDDTAETRYQQEPAHEVTPEKMYERRWALTLLEHAMNRLRRECTAAGKSELFECAEGMLSGADGAVSYAEVGSRLGMTEGAVRTAVHRLRRRYAGLLREEIAQTVSRPEDVEEEIQHLFQAVSP